MSKLIASAALGLILPLPATTVDADESRATAAEVVARVHAAVALIERDGARALERIASPSGHFIWKDTYVFVVNCEADRVMVNIAFPERVGGDIKKHTDYAGKQYGLELCAKAGAGGGWIEYTWLRPDGDEPMRKISYVVDVPGQPFQVGAGIYDESASLRELNAATAD